MSLALWAVGWGVQSARAADLEVGGGGYASIQDALNAAADGDRLLLHGGTYTGTYDIWSATPLSLTVEPWPSESVTLVVEDTPTAVTDGFFYARGIDLVVRDVTIDGNGNRGAKVSLGGRLRLENVEIFDASREGPGAALYAETGGRLELQGCYIHDNHAPTPGTGAAVAVTADSVLAADTTWFESNDAPSGGGGAIDCSGVCTVTRSTFVGNAAGGGGGAVWLRAGTGSVLSGNRFCTNSAAQHGGAVRVSDGARVGSLDHNVFFENYSEQRGGAVHSDQPLEASSNDFLANMALDAGSAIYGNSNVFVYNTIAIDSEIGDGVFYGSGMTVDHFLLDAATNAAGPGVVLLDDLYGQPQYVDYTPGDCEGSDLHLDAGSPALGAGDGVHGDDLGALGPVCVVDPGGEIAGDGIDSDCDGSDLCFFDEDDDGHGSTATVVGTTIGCNGYQESPLDDDCDDTDPDRGPGRSEIPGDGVDADCDGFELCYVDEDGDLFGSDAIESSADLTCSAPGLAAFAGDCNDNDITISPGAPERCEDGVDNNCNEVIDLDAEDVPWYADSDGDYHGNPTISVVECAPPAGYVSAGDDCNDNDATVYFGAEERCDGIDNDCDLEIDEALPAGSSWPDRDGDGFGDPNSSSHEGCLPDGYAGNALDCDDSTADIRPGAEEICDGFDNNCDGFLETCDRDILLSEEDKKDAEPIGCGCGPSPLRPGLLGGLLALLALRRRRCSAG